MLGGKFDERVLVGVRGRSYGWIVVGENCGFVAMGCTL
jgi:hypothetical protein